MGQRRRLGLREGRVSPWVTQQMSSRREATLPVQCPWLDQESESGRRDPMSQISIDISGVSPRPLQSLRGSGKKKDSVS